MRMRTIPYGYAVQNGKNIPHTAESKIVRRIFKDYLGGKSLLKIAQALTAENIEFLPGRHDWNKNRIKRIIEDIRYIGTDTYPSIVSEDMIHKVKALKNERSTVKDSNNHQGNKSENPFRLPCSVECFCGIIMKRRHDIRRKTSQELWNCQNPDCKRVVNINDDDLLAKLTELLNLLIDNPSLIYTELPDDTEPPLEVKRLNNEVVRQLDGLEFDKSQLKADIFSLADEKYRQINPQNTISKMLRAEFEQQTSLSLFSHELFKRTVAKIRFTEYAEPSLILKNNQTIGKEQPNADSDNADSYDNPAN